MVEPNPFFSLRELTLDEKEKVLADLAISILNGEELEKFKDMFVDDIRYNIFVNSIAKRIKTIEKMVIVRTNENVYLLTLHDYEHVYLLGFDSNKLFIIKANDIKYHLDLDKATDIRDNVIYRLEDTNSIYLALGYDYDLASSVREEETIIEKDGRYRVQGDIVFNVIKEGDIIRAYGEAISGSLANQLAQLLRALIIRRTVNILTDIGFSVHVRDNNTIVIPGLSRSADQYECEAICKLIMDRLSINDIVNELTKTNNVIWVDREDLEFETPRGWLVELRYDTRGTYGYRFKDCEINIFVHEERLRERIVDSENSILWELVREIEPGEVIVRRGRHVIVAEKALPTTITFSIKPNIPEVERDIIVTVGTGRIYNIGRVTVSHPEHGQITIAFRSPVSVDIENTRIEEEFADRLNHYLIKKLFKF